MQISAVHIVKKILQLVPGYNSTPPLNHAGDLQRSGLLESQPSQRIRRNNQNTSKSTSTHSTNSYSNNQRQLSFNQVPEQFISETTLPLLNQPYGSNAMVQMNVPDTRVHISAS